MNDWAVVKDCLISRDGRELSSDGQVVAVAATNCRFEYSQGEAVVVCRRVEERESQP